MTFWMKNKLALWLTEGGWMIQKVTVTYTHTSEIASIHLMNMICLLVHCSHK